MNRDEEDARTEDGEWATDDLSGEFINVSEVRAARKEQTQFMNDGDKDRADLFASTPPLDTIMAVLVLVWQDLGEDLVAVLVDVKKAKLNSRVQPEDGDHFITLPEEMGCGCAKLKRSAPARRRRQRSTVRRVELDTWFMATISHSLARERTCSG